MLHRFQRGIDAQCPRSPTHAIVEPELMIRPPALILTFRMPKGMARCQFLNLRPPGMPMTGHTLEDFDESSVVTGGCCSSAAEAAEVEGARTLIDVLE